MQISLSSQELLTFFFSHNLKIQDGGGRHLGFAGYVNSPFRRVDSVVFELCTKFGSNICYSHWDRRTYASDFYSMTSRELTSSFDFWSRTWSSPHGRDGSSNKILCRYFLSSPELLTFFRNPRWRQPPSWIFRLCEFGRSGVLMVWYLCYVPNLVQISVIVIEIDALILQTFIWWRHAN